VRPFNYETFSKHRGIRITTTIEHPAVLGAAKFLEHYGCRVTYLEIDGYGWLDPERLRNAITDDTVLVSIMMANNEVGTILPIKELCAIAHERGIPFHTDAIQAIGKIAVDVQELDADMLSLSGHKFHAPKGIGALYVNKAIELEPLLHGGKQESGLEELKDGRYSESPLSTSSPALHNSILPISGCDFYRTDTCCR